MSDLLLFLLGSCGFTIVFIQGSIFNRLREIISFNDFTKELFSCPMCFGFWVGVVSSLYFEYNPFLSGFSVSLLSWIIYNFVELMNIIYDNKEIEFYKNSGEMNE